jgi:hypothetical protein
MSTNGEFHVPDQNQDRDQPSSSLDIYSEVVRPGTDDPVLNEANYGLGVHSNAEYYQNVESLRRGLFAKSAFERPIVDRAVRETHIELGRDALSSTDEKTAAELAERGKEIWDDMNDEQQQEALATHAGLTTYRPTFLRMATGRTELSRSKNGRLIDNVFGRVSESIHRASEEARQALAKLGGD